MDQENEPVNGVDTAWLRMDSPTNLMVINAMLVADKVSFDDFKELISSRLLKFERFSKRPVCYSGLHYWEIDPLFDIDSHVRKVALTGSADKQELQNYVSEQMSVPLDVNRPLWQIHFVDNYLHGSAILIRTHHCYADGISLVKVFDAITEPAANVTAIRPAEENVNNALKESIGAQEGEKTGPDASVAELSSEKPDISSAESHNPDMDNPWAVYQGLFELAWQTLEKYSRVGQRFSEESLHMLRDPLLAKGYAKDILRIINEITNLAALPSDPETGLKGTLGIRKVCAWSDPISFSGLKDASKLLGCKINDILVASVAGALGQYLAGQGESVENKTIHATVPVNIRLTEDTSELDNTLGNNFGTVFLPLPIGISNPIERVYKIKHDMLNLKNSLQPGISFGLLYAVGMMPKAAQKPLMDVFSKKSTTVLSNVPGVRETRYLCGQKIKEQMFWVPQTADIGLGMSLISYGDAVQFGVTTDAKICDHPQTLVELCVNEMKHYIDMIDPYQEIYYANSRRCTDKP